MNNLYVSFASDNTAGAHPKILDALSAVNNGYQKPYGDDEITKKAVAKFKEIFGEEIEVCLALNGLGANILALRSMLRPWEGVICADISHINTDESGAPEFCTGSKMLAMPSINGKISPQDLDKYINEGQTYHRVCPRVASISQSTEQGTLYSLDEIHAITSYAHEKNLLTFMDGSRLSNACAALNVDLKTMTKDAGIDVLALGGTKNGLVFGEAILFFKPELAENYKRIRKQSLQLISKMRYISAQFLAYFEDKLWLKNAKNANEMAQYMAEEFNKIDYVKVQQPEANAVFIDMEKKYMEKLMDKFYCYEMDNGQIRLMCSFSTTKKEVDELINYVKSF